MWNNPYRTPTECWQKTSDFPKGKKIPTYLGRAKEKRKNRGKRIGMGPATLGGRWRGKRFHTLGSPFTGRDGGWWRGEASEPWRRAQQKGCRGQSGEIPTQRIGADQHSPAWDACLLTCQGRWGLGTEARASDVRPQGEDWGWLHEESLKGASAPQLAGTESGKRSGPAWEARDHCFGVREERGFLLHVPTEGRTPPKQAPEMGVSCSYHLGLQRQA